ncbi:MAG: T9SS type A sorting domain-containing protein [Chitinophagaceae bacterium]|nr:T9SS type A sorting domain-containing protein [Chitinophagaceae bacterium]
MKTKLTILFLLLLIQVTGFAQYIAVKARYTETRLVDDAPNPPKRENRLVLHFYFVSASGIYTPASLNNYDIWIFKQGFQYGNVMGGVLDSSGNNYPGYAFPAPIAVSYYNSLGLHYIDCDPNAATHYTVNGSQLDCGFVPVSYWDVDGGTGIPFEAFPAPNILLPYYDFTHPYYFSPGNINFPYVGGPPYNWYNYSCGGPQQLVIRGVLAHADSTTMQVPLPVQFADVTVVPENNDAAKLSWSNLTESDIAHYVIERSLNGGPFTSIDTVLPIHNNGSRADYSFVDTNLQRGDDLLYRVLAVELNGKQVYSPVVHLQLPLRNLPQVEPELLLFPNPVIDGRCLLQIPHLAKNKISILLYDVMGQVRYQKTVEHAGGRFVYALHLPILPQGMYYLMLRSTGSSITKKVFIQ